MFTLGHELIVNVFLQVKKCIEDCYLNKFFRYKIIVDVCSWFFDSRLFRVLQVIASRLGQF